jgi:lipopolysaccharide/colanic/teichoic acid biosynthesis glycosyltransferase
MNGRTKTQRREPHRLAFKPPSTFVRFSRPGRRRARLGDFFAACTLIAFTLPLMALAAIAIKFESPGPVFERQQCVGIGGRRFDALSFRSTLHAVEDADLAWRRAAQMTRLGPYLRSTRIDELPQLFNVLRVHALLSRLARSDRPVRERG